MPVGGRLRASWGVCKMLLRCIWRGDRSWAYVATTQEPSGRIKCVSVVFSAAPGDMMRITERINEHCREQRELQVAPTDPPEYRR
jgi:hypothetical protein